MSTQGPIVVNTGADGGDFGAVGSQAWTNAANAGSTSSASYTNAAPNAGTSHNLTNTLKCKFNAGAFFVPAGRTVSQIAVTFQAAAATSGYNIRVHSVKTSLTGATDLGDEASLATVDPTFTTFAYTFSGLAIGTATINGAWEIDLQIDWDLVSGSVGDAHVYKVEATVTYSFADEDIDNPNIINQSVMISNAVEDWGRR